MIFKYLIFTLAFFAMLAVGNALYLDDPDLNIYNATETKIIWNSSEYEPQPINNSYYLNNGSITNLNEERLTRVLYKTIDYFGFVLFETAKWFIEFGFNHPEYNFQRFINYVPWIVGILVFGSLFMPVCILFVGIYYLIKWIRNRKRKKKNGHEC